MKILGYIPQYPKDMTLGYWVLCSRSLETNKCLRVSIQMSSYKFEPRYYFETPVTQTQDAGVIPQN